MKRVILADYIGNCDENGKPIGHPLKVLDEYGRLLETNFQVDYIVPNNMRGELVVQNVKYVPYYINPNVQSSVEKLFSVLKKLWNIKKIFQLAKGEKIWFCNIDFYLFLYLFMFVKKSKYVICTIYRQNFGGDGSFGKIKNFIFEKALSKVDLLICSNENLHFPNNKCIFVPDYFYLPDKYEKYVSGIKDEKIVCLGTMGKNKCLEAMLMAFKDKNINLEVCGKFSDISEYEHFKTYENQYISISNSYLSEEEYLQKLGSAKYCILPYNMELYCERTSGVILEAIFLNTVPITDIRLLDYNNLPGIGYQNLSEVCSLVSQNQTIADFYECANAIKQERYNKEKIREMIITYLG